VAYTDRQLREGALTWLLEVTLRGRVYRFAERALTLSIDGVDTLYRSGLSPIEYVDAIAEPGTALDERSVGIELIFDGADAEGWSAIAATDIDLGDATAILALWLTGQTYASREVILSGRVESPSFGLVGDPVSFEITESPWSVAGPLFPPAEAVIDATTWPRGSTAATHSIGADAEGQPYPWVIGSPGRADPNGDPFPAMSLPLVEMPNTGVNSVDPAYFLVAGHVAACQGVADSLRIYNRTQAWVATATPFLSRDSLGRVVTLVSVPGALGVVRDGDEVYASFDKTEGGVVGSNGSTMGGAAEIISYLLGYTGARVDSAGIESASRELRAFDLDFVITEHVDPLDLLIDDVLPLLPGVWGIGARGLRVVPWRWSATARDATFRLDPDTVGADLTGPVQTTSARDVANHLRIEYALDIEADRHLGRVSFAPYPSATDTAREVHPFSRASATRYGEQRASDLVSDYVMSRSSARAALDWRLAWYAHPRAVASFVLPQEYQAVRPGDIGLVTHSGLGWSDRVVIALSLVRRPGDTEMTVTTVPNWVAEAT